MLRGHDDLRRGGGIIKRGELKDRAKFFSERLLGLPYRFDVRFATKADAERFDETFSVHETRGLFCGSNGWCDYDEDCYESEEGQCDCARDDALILIAPGLKRDLPEMNGVLIHELIHYKLWYLGYPSGDNTLEFRREAEKLMVIWDRQFDKEKHKWFRIETPEQRAKLCEYEQMYQDYVKGVG